MTVIQRWPDFASVSSHGGRSGVRSFSKGFVRGRVLIIFPKMLCPITLARFFDEESVTIPGRRFLDRKASIWPAFPAPY